MFPSRNMEYTLLMLDLMSNVLAYHSSARNDTDDMIRDNAELICKNSDSAAQRTNHGKEKARITEIVHYFGLPRVSTDQFIR